MGSYERLIAELKGLLENDPKNLRLYEQLLESWKTGGHEGTHDEDAV